MLDWLYKGIGAVLGWFSDITGSYALALLLYALVFKLLFLFFSIKQQKNQIAMAKLTPKIELIRAKYKGRTDQATLRKQQEEILELQRKEGYSPLSGCLPLLIQMPIIIFLYNVIRKPLSFIANVSDEVIVNINNFLNPGSDIAFKNIDQITLIGQIKNYNGYDSASFLLDLGMSGEQITKIPNFTLWGLDLANKPAEPVFWNWLLLIPFIAAAFQWLSMFISRKLSGNANQLAEQSTESQMSLRMMDLIMPLMTVFFAFSFSSMMGLYWIFQSILGIIQTFILHKIMPIPKFTEEEIREIKRARKAQEKAQNAIIKTQPKYKSLHYIDEDDYDELPEAPTGSSTSSSANQGTKKLSGDGAPEIKD